MVFVYSLSQELTLNSAFTSLTDSYNPCSSPWAGGRRSWGGQMQSISEIEASWREKQREFERQRGVKVICIIHRDAETIGFQPPVDERLSVEEATDIISEIEKVGKSKRIEVILHTPGGSAWGTETVAGALLTKEVVTYVPYLAMSGGTEIALATEQIHLGSNASLGPVDLQIAGFSIAEWQELVDAKGGIGNLADVYAMWALKAAREGKKDPEKVAKLINDKHVRWHRRLFKAKRQADKLALAEKLTNGELAHSHRIMFKEAHEKLRINVCKGVPKVMFDLVDLRREQLKQIRVLESELHIASAAVAPMDADVSMTVEHGDKPTSGTTEIIPSAFLDAAAQSG